MQVTVHQELLDLCLHDACSQDTGTSISRATKGDKLKQATTNFSYSNKLKFEQQQVCSKLIQDGLPVGVRTLFLYHGHVTQATVTSTTASGFVPKKSMRLLSFKPSISSPPRLSMINRSPFCKMNASGIGTEHTWHTFSFKLQLPVNFTNLYTLGPRDSNYGFTCDSHDPAPGPVRQLLETECTGSSP